ncbi:MULTISPECIES: hypothetical protein [Microbacterium]|uniref:DUF222 domain-containing protein n=1 Tax=Microbacterium wangchenii TaxID=2541726 RepID=A0ABX5SUK4_9MICO|nr:MULTISPECIES: hypothetical protein [Microbacterium]MCK6067196.1 hypothetical protein [Microbacterium sp. EYE_512]QBR89851.1 hypothetical protein E4K62_14865 [Microbacterium wangchenii]TXK16552.1 hypothetical protein FVP99_07650 [Microbacterium wangchenii]
MDELVGTLRDLIDRADAAVGELIARDAFGIARDDDILEALSLAGRLERRVEAVLVELAGEAAARSGSPDRDARLTSHAGCHDVSELLQRTTRVAPQTAAKWQRAARAVRGQVSPSSGEVLPPFLPALRAVMTAGEAGVDGVLAVSTALATLDRRVPREDLLVADEILPPRHGEPDRMPPRRRARSCSACRRWCGRRRSTRTAQSRATGPLPTAAA